MNRPASAQPTPIFDAAAAGFITQKHIHELYHMDDIKVFYNKEDAWQIPNEVYGVGKQVKVEPYYIIMKLPGEEKEEFVLMTSFSPIKKDNTYFNILNKIP